MSIKENSLDRTISQIWSERYVIPLYQRNFAWTEDQIGQLLQDLYDHTPKSKADFESAGNYYLGSLVLLKRRDGHWEVIDGQQRLTALHLICRYLNILEAPRLSFDSRPSVEKFLDNLFSTKSWSEIVKENQNTEDNKTIRLKEALSIIDSYQIRTGENDETVSLASMSDPQKELLARYIRSKVILVCTPLPEDTDVASYFEIMNNRGEQLQSHEILKAILMRDLGKDSRKVFADIWDACSQMDVPIQRTLPSLRSIIFGDNFDIFNPEGILDKESASDVSSDAYGIDEILAGNFEITDSACNDYIVSDSKYRSIIDFPNFLMHVLRLYASKKKYADLPPLNADAIPVTHPKYINDSLDFAKFLLKTRVLFDRYIIKIQGTDDESEDLKWRLLCPYKDSNGQLLYRNTFSTNEPSDNDEDWESGNRRILMQQSMLQVSFPNRKYKEWLNALLTWLEKATQKSIIVDEREMSKFLDNWIFGYYTGLINSWNDAKAKDRQRKDILASGVNTPHFLLNYIDYLYWLAAQGKSSIRYIDRIHQFQFKYYNSVEHHLPQSYEQIDDVDLDMIGNLCLLSRRKNSSLNDKSPIEKAKIERGIQPKRRIMYEITQDFQQWGHKEIKDHQEDIRDLLRQSENLLALRQNE